MGVLDIISTAAREAAERALAMLAGSHTQPPPSPSSTATTTPPETNSGRGSAAIICNTRAGRGSVAGPAQTLPDRFEKDLGFTPISYQKTRPTALERQTQVREMVSNLITKNKPIELVLIGGDGTVVPSFQTAFETALGRSLADVEMTPEANAQIWRHFSGITIFSVGTAADLSRQNGAPPSYLFLAHQFLHRHLPTFTPAPDPFRSLESYMQESVIVPWSIPLHRFNGEGPYHATTEAAGIGLDGLMFSNVEEIRNNTGKVGLNLYFSALAKILVEQVGRQNWSYDANLTVNGNSRGVVKNIGSTLITPNSFLAGVGGIPGPWNSVKLFLIPANRQGVATLTEAIRRGILTRMGFDQISTARAMNALPAGNQSLLEVGDRFTLESTRVPNDERGVPAEINGDGLRNAKNEAELVNKVEGYVAPVFAPARAHPHSIAARLHSLEALRRGDFLPEPQAANTTPYRTPTSHILMAAPEYRASLQCLPLAQMMNSAPKLQSNQQASTFYPSADLHHLANEHHLQEAAIPRLLEAAHAQNPDTPLCMNQIQEWARNNSEVSELKNLKQNFEDTGRHRLNSQGGSLALGLLSLLGINRVLHAVGINAEHDPIAHFSLSTLAAHVIQKTAQAVQTPILQLLRGQAFEQRSLQTFASKGISISRSVLTRSSTFSEALHFSLREAFGLSTFRPQSTAEWMRFGARSAGGTLMNAIGGMGLGLIASRATETLLNRYTHLNTEQKNIASGMAFFLPSALQIAFGNSALALFRTRGVALASLGMSVGFAADLLFNSATHLARSSSSAEAFQRNYRQLAQAHDAASHSFIRNLGLGAISTFAPELGTYLRSVF